MRAALLFALLAASAGSARADATLEMMQRGGRQDYPDLVFPGAEPRRVVDVKDALPFSAGFCLAAAALGIRLARRRHRP